MTKQIIMTYNKDGTVTTDVQGFHGKGCLEATQKLLQGLNAKIDKTKLKAEFNEVEKTAIKLDVRSG
jgi:hypothetical protein